MAWTWTCRVMRIFDCISTNQFIQLSRKFPPLCHHSRFLEMFGNVVLEIPRSLFEDELDDIKYEKGANEDTDLTAEDLKEVVARFKKVYETMDMTFPQDVLEQLKLSGKDWLYTSVASYCSFEYNSHQSPQQFLGLQSVPFSRDGWEIDPSNTEKSKISEIFLGRPSMFKQWSLVIWERHPPLAFALQGKTAQIHACVEYKLT
jgi:hypothetical protein